MASHLNPYLSFRDNARAAMEFYKSVFGGELTLMTFGEGGMSDTDATKDLVMHGQLVTPSGYWLMGSDTPPQMEHKPGNTMSVSLSGGSESDAELRGYWTRLSEGGTITVPLATAQWGDAFGMLVDRFGVAWLVNIAGPTRG
jgi:PhnB protein